jgi:ABC-type microcin C transport system permease subunit YejB
MISYILRKLLLIVPTVIGISICAFAFVRLLPGDPILAMAGEQKRLATTCRSGSNISIISARS